MEYLSDKSSVAKNCLFFLLVLFFYKIATS